MAALLSGRGFFPALEVRLNICPECGCLEAAWIKDIRYPSGSVTSLLECPQCERMVLVQQVPQGT